MSATYKEPLVDIAILDYERPKELEILLSSLKVNAKFPHRIVYLGNGGDHSYVDQYRNQLDVCILNKENVGCGLATRQLIQSCMSKTIIYAQVDQYLIHPIDEVMINYFISQLSMPNIFHIDLAGNQGHGKFSERASLLSREKYLSIPDLDKIIGGPGPYAQFKWTEQFVQEHMVKNNLTFKSTHLFADNGKVSIREYGEEYGGKTMHYTDEKRLFILEPFKKKAESFPNLNLNEEEWNLVLSGAWPKEGKIPEADKAHSFIYWKL